MVEDGSRLRSVATCVACSEPSIPLPVQFQGSDCRSVARSVTVRERASPEEEFPLASKTRSILRATSLLPCSPSRPSTTARLLARTRPSGQLARHGQEGGTVRNAPDRPVNRTGQPMRLPCSCSTASSASERGRSCGWRPRLGRAPGRCSTSCTPSSSRSPRRSRGAHQGRGNQR